MSNAKFHGSDCSSLVILVSALRTKNVRKPCPGIEIIKLCSYDQHAHEDRMIGAVVQSGEAP